MYKDIREELALALERFLISYFGRIDTETGILTNRTDGGEGLSGFVPTQETRSKQSAAKMGKKLPEGTKRKISAALTGVPKKPFSKETRQKISEANRRRKVTLETRQKMSRTRLGRKRSAETIQKCIEGQLLPIPIFTSRLAWCNPLFTLVTQAVSSRKSLFRCRYCLEEFIGYDNNMLAGHLPKDHYQCGMEAFDLNSGTRVYSVRGSHRTKPLRVEVPSPQDTPFTFSLRRGGVIFSDLDGRELSRARLPESYVRARIQAEKQFSDYGV